jgi:hypothetical protein
MKALKFVPVLLFLLTPLFAEPPASTPPPELAKLRQKYVDSLNDLLQQFVKAGNSDAADAVSREIGRFSPCGVWTWDADVKTVTIHDDGTVTQNTKSADKNSKDSWHWTDQASGKFAIVWDSGLVDSVTLSPDGKTMFVKSNSGSDFVVRRLQQVQVVDAGAHAN